MDIAAERIFGPAMRDAEPCPSWNPRLRDDERQSHRTKRPQPEGFRQEWPGDFVAPQSQVHGGHAPSSRLVGGPFLAKQQYPQFFNRRLGFRQRVFLYRHVVFLRGNGLVSDGCPFFSDAKADRQQGWTQKNSNKAECQSSTDNAEENQQEGHVAALTDEPGPYKVINTPHT
jgi:hypothetical protein